MREITYRVYGRDNRRKQIKKGLLHELLFDAPFSFSANHPSKPGVVFMPPVEVLNQMLMTGGGEEGFEGNGINWDPLSISSEEYYDLCFDLSQVYLQPIQENYMFCPSRIIIDEELNEKFKHSREWEKAILFKYVGLSLPSHQFVLLEETYSIFCDGLNMGEVYFNSFRYQKFWIGGMESHDIAIFESLELIKVDIRAYLAPFLISFFKNELWYKVTLKNVITITNHWGQKQRVNDFLVSESSSVVLKVDFKTILPEIEIL